MSFAAFTRRNRQPLWLFTLALLLAPGLLHANLLSAPPERRIDQYPTENGYLILPLPYSIPGIGEGYFLMGYLSNLFGSTADAFVVRVAGDAEGYVAKFDVIHLDEVVGIFAIGHTARLVVVDRCLVDALLGHVEKQALPDEGRPARHRPDPEPP